MSLTQKRTRELDELFARRGNPKRVKTSEAYYFPDGARRVMLSKPDGTLTAAGVHYEQRVGPLPTSFAADKIPEREANTEYITLQNGKRAITRQFDPATGEYTFTDTGRRYYRNIRRNYVVQVPVVIDGRRKDGSTYRIKIPCLYPEWALAQRNSL